jgi:hypothetical protein
MALVGCATGRLRLTVDRGQLARAPVPDGRPWDAGEIADDLIAQARLRKPQNDLNLRRASHLHAPNMRSDYRRRIGRVCLPRLGLGRGRDGTVDMMALGAIARKSVGVRIPPPAST